MKKFNFKYILFFLILLLGFWLRIIGLNKQAGLDFDEAITYICASQPFPLGIVKFLAKTDVHMPLYFLILNLWIKIFSNSDVILRLLSVLFGEGAIIFGYFAGKELKNSQTGLVCALLLAINSLGIFYSQNVRFYSLLLLLSSAILWSFIKTVKFTSAKNLSILAILCLAIIYTNTIAIIFVSIIFAELIGLFFIKKDNMALKQISIAILLSIIALIPFCLIFYQISIHRGSGFPDMVYFDNQTVFSVFQNWFSPILCGLFNSPNEYLKVLFHTISLKSVIFIIMPVLIGFGLIFKNNFKKDTNYLTLLTIVAFIFIELVGCYSGKFFILPRYTLFILPFVMLLIANAEFKHKKIYNILVTTFVLINLLYLICFPASAPKMANPAGQRIPALILQKYNITKGDIVVFPIRDNLSDKYYNSGYKRLKMLEIFSDLFPETNLKSDITGKYKKIFASKSLPTLKNYFNKEIYNQLHPGDRLVILVESGIMPYDEKSFPYILNNETMYKKQPVLFMKLYKVTDELMKDSSTLTSIGAYHIGNWFIAIYQK